MTRMRTSGRVSVDESRAAPNSRAPGDPDPGAQSRRIAAFVTRLVRCPDSFSVDELVTAADTEATRFADEAERVLLSDPVPTCPDWTVRQLVEHLGGVHRWAAAIVARGLLQDLPAAEQTAFAAPKDRGELLPWFRAGARQLMDALKAAPDDLRAFVFLKARRRPSTSGRDARHTRRPSTGSTRSRPGSAGCPPPRRPRSPRTSRWTASTSWSPASYRGGAAGYGPTSRSG